MTLTEEKRLTRQEAATYLTEHGFKIAPATLAKMASVGGGPVFTSYGRKPLYKATDLLEWAKSRCSGPRLSTSDKGGAR